MLLLKLLLDCKLETKSPIFEYGQYPSDCQWIAFCHMWKKIVVELQETRF